MNITKITTITAALSATLLLNIPRLTAQDASPAPSAAPSASAAPSGSPAADGNRRGGGNMEDFRARMNDRIKTALKATDDEWTVIQPLLEKVQTLQFAGRGNIGGFGGFNRRGRDGGNQPSASASPSASPSNNNRPDRIASPEATALKTALDADGTSNDDIKAKLQALRDSRKKNAADLAQAREDLKKVLTLRQEATLVNMGILE